MASWEFPGSDPVSIEIDIAAGHIAVSGEPAAATTVELHSTSGRDDDWLAGEVTVTFAAGRLSVLQRSHVGMLLRARSGIDLVIKAPAGSSATIRTASAAVGCLGELSAVHAKTASGDVTAASVTGPLDITTASGDVALEKGGAAVAVHTASGKIWIRQADDEVSLSTASGDVRVGSAARSVSVQTASGDVRVGSLTAGEARVKTVSGDTRLGIASGAPAYLDLSSLTGQVRSRLEATAASDDVPLRVQCRSVSGDIEIARATA